MSLGHTEVMLRYKRALQVLGPGHDLEDFYLYPSVIKVSNLVAPSSTSHLTFSNLYKQHHRACYNSILSLTEHDEHRGCQQSLDCDVAWRCSQA